MFVKDLKFGCGLGFFRETQIYLFPANYVLACFNLGLDNFEPTIWKNNLRGITFDDSYILFEKFKDLPKKQVFDNFLDYVKYFGFGEVKLLASNEKKLIFTLVSDSYKNYYSKLYGHIPKVSPDEIMAGFLENYFSLVYGKKLMCNIIELHNGVNFELDITEEDFNLVSDRVYPNFEPGSVSLSLKKLLLHKAVTFEKGFFLVSGIKAFNLPYFFFLNFLNLLEGDNILKTFNSLGYVQGKAAVDLHRFLGKVESKDVFDAICDLIDLSGLGLYEVSDLDSDKISFKLKNNINYYSIFYDNLVLKIFNTHIAHCFKGDYDFSFGVNSTLNLDCGSDCGSNCEFDLINLNKGLVLSDEEENLYKFLTTKVLYTDKK